MSGRYLQLEDLDGAVEVDRSPALERLDGGPGEPLIPHDFRLSGTVDPETGGGGATFRGRVEGRVELSCSRCLDRFDFPVQRDFFLTFVPEPFDEFAPVEPEESLFHAPGGRADLDAVVREQIWLSLPLKPLCRPDCRGLCPTCGANRNRIECGCRVEQIDPRLAPLLRFRRERGDA